MAAWLKVFKNHYIRLINLSNFAQGCLSTLTGANLFISSPTVPLLKPNCLAQSRSLSIVFINNIYSAFDMHEALD